MNKKMLIEIDRKAGFCMKHRILSILVDNTSGVLSRVAGLFSRRGYNIDSLTVGVTADPKYSRMTVVASGDDQVLEQITRQLEKLVDVIDIKVLQPSESINRELILVKIKADASERQNIISIADIFRAKIVDVGTDSLIVELTGTQSKLDGFLNLLQGYEILELARTGITGLSRGMDDVRYLD
jgi:acetolactate synthase-1/3 small subunit